MNVERRAPIAIFSAGAATGAVALASGAVAKSGLKVVAPEGDLSMIGGGTLLTTGVGALWITGVTGCTAVKRHGSMGAMICSGGCELPLVADAGGAVGGAAGVPEL